TGPDNFSHSFMAYIEYAGLEELFGYENSTRDWEHIVVVYNKQLSKQFIYSNGLQISVRNVGVERYPATNNATYIGYSTVPFGKTNLDNPFKGALDDIGFWSRPLELKEIIDLYNGSCSTSSISNQILN